MLDRQFLYITTLITTEWQGHAYSGTGFFFQQKEPAMKDNKLGNYFLVTNRHVVYSAEDGAGKKHLVDKLTFRVRAEEKATQKLIWIEMTISQSELIQKAKVLPDTSIDVCVIDICDKVDTELAKYNNLNVTICPIEESNLADKSRFAIECSDDVVVIGYPRGFYDTVNLYPIVKNGTIASMWGADFRGSKGFAIDAKLFPGSSGSLVITKPRMEDLDKDGHLIFKKEKIFYCLGIYSGEPIFKRLTITVDGKPAVVEYTFDLGQVWYYHLIPDTIQNGVAPQLEV
jgi:V8-like Glu-specific endopeptidase